MRAESGIRRTEVNQISDSGPAHTSEICNRGRCEPHAVIKDFDFSEDDRPRLPRWPHPLQAVSTSLSLAEQEVHWSVAAPRAASGLSVGWCRDRERRARLRA